MSKSAVAEKIDLTARKVPQVDPGNVRINTDGFVFRTVFVRLPEELVLDDLKENIWRKVQGSPHVSLRKFDRLTLAAYDESWLAEAIVGEATVDRVVLAGIKRTELPARYDALYSDDQYQVVWIGNGFRVQRRRDGHFMTDAVATAGAAQRDLINLYPRPVGA